MDPTISTATTWTGDASPAGGALPLLLRRLSLFAFKNYPSAELLIHSNVVCFLGPNGSGKTNLLDAIHYLCLCKSYFNSTDSQNITVGEEQSGITGDFLRDGLPENIVCALRKGQRKLFKRNHKEYDRLADHIGSFPAVIITPYDAELINDGSEVRRKFIDASISQQSRPALEALLSYNQALLQRNNLLKQRPANLGDLLEPWNYQLARFSETIYSERTAFIENFTPLFAEVYAYITQGSEVPSIQYVSDKDKGDPLELLQRQFARDQALERTTAGPHKDELEFTLDGLSLKKFASQGQQKSFLIALKLAQLQYLRNHLRAQPVLLLDDLFDKVDEQRVTRLLEWLHMYHPGQVFITDTDLQRIPSILSTMAVTHQVFSIFKATVQPIA
jgi:DNA replication and repair protein RecF